MAEKMDIIESIVGNADDALELSFKTIDSTAMEEINSWLPEVQRAENSFHKRNSQTSMNLMTLNMVDSGPLRVLRQILAQVSKKRLALTESWYELEKKKIKYQELKMSPDTPSNRLEMQKIRLDISNIKGPIEAALKEIGSLKRSYQEICKNKGIPENWDEADFESAEIEHHIKSIFRNAVRDRMQGTHNQGTMEYMEQFGINPIAAYSLVDKYLSKTRALIRDAGVCPDIAAHYQFFDEMYETFKNSWKKAADRIGLSSVVHDDFLFKDIK